MYVVPPSGGQSSQKGVGASQVPCSIGGAHAVCPGRRCSAFKDAGGLHFSAGQKPVQLEGPCPSCGLGSAQKKGGQIALSA